MSSPPDGEDFVRLSLRARPRFFRSAASDGARFEDEDESLPEAKAPLSGATLNTLAVTARPPSAAFDSVRSLAYH